MSVNVLLTHESTWFARQVLRTRDQEPQARKALAESFAKDLMDTIVENY